jgi:hypothetical protein
MMRDKQKVVGYVKLFERDEREGGYGHQNERGACVANVSISSR